MGNYIEVVPDIRNERGQLLYRYQNIKGITKQEQQSINNYIELVETLSQILKG